MRCGELVGARSVLIATPGRNGSEPRDALLTTIPRATSLPNTVEIRDVERLDAWLAKTIFWPIIIKICQETGCTKWAFGRLCAFLWICGVILTTTHWTWFWSIFIAIIAISETVSLGLRRDAPYGQSGFARAVFWIALALGIFDAVTGDGQPARPASTLAMLFSLYAATLPTVPPKRRKEDKKASASRVSA